MSQAWAQEKRYLGWGQFVWLNTLTDNAEAVSPFIDKSKNDTGLSEVIVNCDPDKMFTGFTDYPQVTLSWVTRLTSLSSLKINKYFYTQEREKNI